MNSRQNLQLEVLPQPDDTTCGPTCLHAVYRYYGDETPLDTVIAETPALPDGGTLAVNLACHALRREYEAEIYTYNLKVFDPTWFDPDVDLASRLEAQAKHKRKRKKLGLATRAYLEFLEAGGTVRFEDLTPKLLRRFVDQGVPVLTGLSATYLYGCARERNDTYDDTRGEPAGHFVVLSGYDRSRGTIIVADPLQDNPSFGSHYYQVDLDRLIGAILLGVVTYDANILVIRPRP